MRLLSYLTVALFAVAAVAAGSWLLAEGIDQGQRIRSSCAIVGWTAAATGVLCLYWRFSIVFLVVIQDGVAKVHTGKVAGPFLEQVGECCRDAGIAYAEVWGRGGAGFVRLGFSGSVPPNVQQRIRNIWVSTAPRRGRPFSPR